MENTPTNTQLMASAAMREFLSQGNLGYYDLYNRLTEDEVTFEQNMLLDGKSCDEYYADDGMQEYVESSQSFVHTENKEDQGLVF